MNKTLIGVLASHDSVIKNNELARIFETLHKIDRDLLGKFHFVFTGGTFARVMLGREAIRDKKLDRVKKDAGEEKWAELIKPIDDSVKEFLLQPDPRDNLPRITVLPTHPNGGVTILANLIVQRQCSIVWPFLSPVTEHWLHPENLALLRLCDLWNAKRLMNAESVRAWFRSEAKRDEERNPQKIPVKLQRRTPQQSCGACKAPLPG